MRLLEFYEKLSGWLVSLVIILLSATTWYTLVPLARILVGDLHYLMILAVFFTAYGRRFRKLNYVIPKPSLPLVSQLNRIDKDNSVIEALSLAELQSLQHELRLTLIRSVAETGGHLGSSLGVIELTIAIHKVFNLPRDQLIWDVGHQTYPHKMLTGRLDRMHTLRFGGGLSGFTNRSESSFDCFGAGHACTAVSAAVGMAIARDLSKQKHFIISVIGDGSLTGGMTFEALNHAGHLRLKNFIVILNDNDQVSLPTSESVVAISRSLRTGAAPHMFRSFGFDYLGPVDGHNLPKLLEILSLAKQRTPVVVHVKTTKGKGYEPAENANDRLHGVGPFHFETGVPKSSTSAVSFTEIFGKSLCEAARKDSRIVAITAAMPGGTGLTGFAKEFGISRLIDVGICEQHAVTCAAGMASAGLKPFVAIYSTFLQRAYDSLIHDVALQNLPVRFILDRAGFVGADGPTHQGMFDIAYLRCIPNIRLCAPADGDDLAAMVAFLAGCDDGPVALRYPRGSAVASFGQVGTISQGRVVFRGGSGDKQVLLLSYGAVLGICVEAARKIAVHATVCVVDARWCKPLDASLILPLAEVSDLCITVEEGSCGGFSGAVLELFASRGLVGTKLKVSNVLVPDVFIEHDTQSNQLKRAGITVERIVTIATS